MFRLRISTILFALLIATGADTALAGVSISVGEPGFFGRIDIGSAPPPRLVYREPIIVRRVSTWYPPLYLRVPPGQIKHWYRYCDAYNACGRPVYFVDDRWYEEEYVPYYRGHRPRVYAPGPPPYRPEYYEYHRHPHRPPERVYIREGGYPPPPPPGYRY